MKKLLIGLSALVVLFVSGCAPSSSPTPKVSSDTASVTELKKACDLNDGDACSKIGVMYFAGKGVQRNHSEALKYYKKACGLNDNKACNMVGIIYEKGKKNYRQAVKYYHKACTLNEGFGCFLLAYSYDSGQGVKQDYRQATKYYRKSCDLSDENGCKAYKNMKKAGY